MKSCIPLGLVPGTQIILGLEPSTVYAPEGPDHELKVNPLAANKGASILNEFAVLVFSLVNVVPLFVVAVPVPEEDATPVQLVDGKTSQVKIAVLIFVFTRTFPSV